MVLSYQFHLEGIHKCVLIRTDRTETMHEWIYGKTYEDCCNKIIGVVESIVKQQNGEI